MTIFQYAAGMEQCFEQFLQSVGKERKTTFFADLSIAECYGADEVKDTYKRVVKSWKNDVEFMSEFCIALNQKIWQHYNKRRDLAEVYNDLWTECDAFCMEHFKGEDLSYYLDYVD